ncbi:branched-chain amino acid ABC transporter permease [Nocardioides pocheonensis]|uniref:Branched-chain amino acid ABC transporter permease n=1 Tax=Nocardioides pocheonensis TaxID=661485 RepID=A0A3N0GXB4_9ACTN|nr:branched-chain amino acid ABC transporter permease [Nocardioides pocheonensis]RNM17077.1 branched-chain amino acid ABC transporter permease [Nocardioides pocheonensis]
MKEFLTYLVTGITLGASFALIGSGFVVVHRVTRIVNFAQGSFAIIAAMMAASLLRGRLPHGLAEAAAVLVCGVVGAVVGWVALGRRGTHPLISLIVTLGLSMLVSAAIILLWGQDPVSPPGLRGHVTLLGVDVERQRLLVLLVTLLAFAAVALFFSRTYLGKALTASASNPYAARLVGIDVRRMGLLAFALAGVLGGLAGVLVAPSNALSFSSDLALALSGFAAAVFGGLSSPGRTLVGGLVLGVAGQLTAGYLNGSYQTEVALLLMLLIMIARSRTFVAEEAK